MNKYLKIGLFFAIYLVIMLVAFLIINNKKNTNDNNNSNNVQKSQYIIFDNYLLIKKVGDTYSQISFENGNYLKEKFYVFENSKYIGQYYYRNMDSDTYLFNDNNESINYKGSLILNNYTDNMLICNLNKQNLTSNDSNYANLSLKKLNINEEFSINDFDLVKYNCDINDDSKLESIYVLNKKTEEVVPEISIIFYIENNNINIISSYNDYTYNQSLVSVVDIDNDNNLEFITTKTNSSTYCFKISKVVDDKIKILKDC